MELQTVNPYASLFWDMLAQAQNTLASDIHIQPEEAGVDVRFRVHGELSRWMWIEDQHKTPFLQQAKQLSNCSLATSGRAQDARIAIPTRKLDVRVNLIPSLFGEKLVLRLLDQRKTFDLQKTGLDPECVQAIRWALDLPDGLVLFTGPTGSGKTTLLYSALTALDQAALNIVTIEDPIEYTFRGITQVQVSSKLSMSDALRAMLRQDPDVILLGEIRDPETAALSFQAAQTGHLVLSTLHANSAFEVASRLSSLGLREDQIRSSLRFTSAQRLLGKLCSKCRTPIPESDLFRRNCDGCSSCLKGLIGRVPIFEFEKQGDSRFRSESLEAAKKRLIRQGLIGAEEIADA
jgi:type II secretory ATPase GspE/PulE/Tfp pilus assembly ATPase PilB-like protein